MNTLILEQFEKIKFWIENDILFCRFNQIDCYLSENDAKIYISKIEKLTKGKSMPFIIDIRQFVGNFSTSAAQLFADSPIMQNILIHAFIADTLNGRLLIGSYNRIYAKAAHVQIFNTSDSALAHCIETKNRRDVYRK